MSLSPARLDRFARHIVLPEVGGVGQVRLSESRVAIIGLGGIGSPALQYLAASGIGHLALVDDDVVDLYGTGATLAEAQEDYWLAFQEACADLSANQDRLAPYLQDQLNFPLICQSLASG